MFGPGAKIQVTYDQPDRVSEVLRFWREVEEEQTMDLISAEDAAQPLREAVAPEGLRRAQGSCSTSRISATSPCHHVSCSQRSSRPTVSGARYTRTMRRTGFSGSFQQ